MSNPHHSTAINLESLEALGQYLREVRQSRKFDLEEAASRLHIRPLYLRALESGNWSDLPGIAYGRGYLRQYAVFLGLSASEVMAVCDRLQGKVQSRLNYLDIVSTEETPSHSMLWLSLAMIVAVLLGWYALQESDETPPEDYSMPDYLAQRLQQGGPGVTPSPYSDAAQECMKLLQKPYNPCYWEPEKKPVPMLAYKLTYP